MFETISRKRSNVHLNEKQQKFIDLFYQGKNIFLTGSGGVGKSFVINHLFDLLEDEGYSIAKTATTGVAAINIGGTTLHSWLGCGLAEGDEDQVLNQVTKNKKAFWRIKKTRALFIDEISMCSADFFNKVEYVVRKIKDPSQPWGGMTVVCAGDWLQLPPVNKTSRETVFAFETNAWELADFEVVYLTENLRQSDDKLFIDILHGLRVGNLEKIHELKKCEQTRFDRSIKPVFLYSTNAAVDTHNERELEKLETPERIFNSLDCYRTEFQLRTLNKNCPVPTKLVLKEGARVFLLHNLDLSEGLCNGAIGTVINLKQKNPIVKFDNGVVREIERAEWEIKEQVVVRDKLQNNVVASRKQIPLKLAYAASIHRAQGKTLDHVVFDAKRIFETGQAYVALSRCTSMDGLLIRNFDESKILVHPKCARFYEELEQNGN